MSARSLFIVLLKLLGLFMIPALIVNVSALVNTLLSMMMSGSETMWPTLFYYAVVAAGQLILIWALLFKPLMVVGKLKLNEDFYDEHFSFHMDMDFMVRMACIAAGIYMVADEIPVVVALLTQRVVESSGVESARPDSYVQLGMSAGRIIVGGLLIGESARITAFINRRRRQAATDDPEAGES